MPKAGRRSPHTTSALWQEVQGVAETNNSIEGRKQECL